MGDRGLPPANAGYTIRTQEIARAQRAAGMEATAEHVPADRRESMLSA